MKYNIISLLNGKIEFEREGQIVSCDLNGIEIPIIQRDYAQGRDSSKFIRNRFLDSIFEALSEDEILEMDFVYGSIKEVKDGNSKHNIFLPLDGQQRLTTLFLLYWFLINTEKIDDNQLEKEREVLKRFSYSTRSTARLFCEKLSSIGYNEKVKESIVSSYWFHKNYTKDPTVMGMLITLEDIQEKYNDIQKKEPDNNLMLFNRMDKLCFYILPLDGFDLTDELYIKMNARGKALTDFENFKADIINWMKSDKNINKEEFDKKVMYKEREIPWYLSIASKFDNSWTDIFWREAKNNKKEDDKIIDPYFLRFIKRFFLNQFIVSSEEKAKEIESSQQFKLLYSVGYEENNKYQSFEDYKEFMEPETLANLEKVLDSFKSNQDSIHNAIQPIWDTNDNWLLYNAKITQIQRILFFAVTKYLENNTYNEEKFKEWIRIVWNIIIDPDIRSIASMITALKMIDKLSKGSANIYNSFLEGSFDTLIEETANIHKNQLIEEKRKIKLLNIEGWKDKIFEAEAHPLFQGNIGFILSDSPNIELFSKRYIQASLLFNKNGTNKDYLNEYKVFRYCISQFTTWDEVWDFNYTNDSKNWQLSLRKNESIKKSILELCSLSEEEIENKIMIALKSTSNIDVGKDENSNEKRVQLIHFNLYHHLELVKCTQKKNISEIRMRNDLVYFVKRWSRNDKILIDGYRHIVINKFCEKMEIKNNKKCGSSDFIFGEQIEFKFNKNDIDWEIIFNGNNKIDIHKYNQEQELLSTETIENDATDNDKAEIVANTIKDLILQNDPI